MIPTSDYYLYEEARIRKKIQLLEECGSALENILENQKYLRLPNSGYQTMFDSLIMDLTLAESELSALELEKRLLPQYEGENYFEYAHALAKEV